jgi:catechol 2,3-dioxygenase-like lactoylglutathione lyase family enzyme
MNLREAIPFFRVADMDRSVHFYVDQLGFAVKNQWVDDGKLRWCRLQREGVSMMFETQHEEFRPKGPPGVGVTIAFICEDAIALYREFSGRGVDASIPQVGNGMWTTLLHDPDGYTLLFESKTDAPEETVYCSEMTTPSPSNRI